MEYTIENIKALLINGNTTKQIGKIFDKAPNTIAFHIRKNNLQEFMKYKKPEYIKDFFKKIDTPEKAYILGFLTGDGDYNKNNIMTLALSKQDICIPIFISKNTGCNYYVSDKTDKEKKIFPKVRISIGDKNYITDFKKYGIFDYKKNRKVPIINSKLYRYLLLGLFDAEGCITWGYRKDRNRLWHKISFTSSLSILYGVQKILDRFGISSAIKPKKDEDCYIIEFSDKERVFKFLNIIYPDNSFIVLERKYKKAIALRRTSGEFRETQNG